MSTRVNLFCPFCNAEGAKQPILSPMTCVYILGNQQQHDAKKAQTKKAGSHLPEKRGKPESQEREGPRSFRWARLPLESPKPPPRKPGRCSPGLSGLCFPSVLSRARLAHA